MRFVSRSSASRSLIIAAVALLLGTSAAGAAALPEPAAFAPEPQPIVTQAPDASVDPASASSRAWTPLPLVTHASVLAMSVEEPGATPSPASAGAGNVVVAMAGAGGQDEEPTVRRSGGGRKALLLSLLLPGAGEMSLGARGRATGFFIAEGAIWTHFVWFQIAGHLRKDNYIEQAQRHAGVGVSDADDTYWKLLGQYETSQGTGPDAYEETLRREARDLFPSDPAAQDAWVAERLPSGDQAWEWTSDEARASYRETRENSRRAFDRSKYSIAAAIVNRILSAIDTQIVSRKIAKEARSDAGRPLLLLADTAPDGSGRLYLTRSF